MGQDGFSWFIGVVEDRQDPKKAGRVRVRCVGYHSASKDDIPMEDLPWASIMMPVTAGGNSGIGVSSHFLIEGTWVVGFFRDGPSAQDPIIMGVINGSDKPDRASPTIKRQIFPSGAQITVNNNTGVIELSGSNAGKVRIL